MFAEHDTGFRAKVEYDGATSQLLCFCSAVLSACCGTPKSMEIKIASKRQRTRLSNKR